MLWAIFLSFQIDVIIKIVNLSVTLIWEDKKVISSLTL
jgi:hypothetical protein